MNNPIRYCQKLKYGSFLFYLSSVFFHNVHIGFSLKLNFHILRFISYIIEAVTSGISKSNQKLKIKNTIQKLGTVYSQTIFYLLNHLFRFLLFYLA